MYCKYRNTVAVFVGGGFKMQKYRNTAVVFAPFWRGLRVNGGWRETNFWDVCKTQHFSFYPDIHAKRLGGWIQNTEIQKYRRCLCALRRGLRVNGEWRETDFGDVCNTQHFLFDHDIRAKHLGGWIQTSGALSFFKYGFLKSKVPLGHFPFTNPYKILPKLQY